MSKLFPSPLQGQRLMRKFFYFFTFLFIQQALFSEDPSSLIHSFYNDALNPTYIFDSVNVITGEYTEAQNDLHLSGPEPLVLRRYHTRNDGFLYGWHCNLPNLINSPMPCDAGRFTESQKISYAFDQTNRLTSLTTSDIHDQTIYGWMHIQYPDNNQCKIQTHDSQELIYHFKEKYLISEVISSEHPPISYQYQSHPLGQGHLLSRRELPDGRFVENTYYEKDHPHAGKVKTQSSPAGVDSTGHITHTFIYHDHYTEVLDALNCKTIYRFFQGHITDIEIYDEQGKIYRAEKIVWITPNREKPPQIKSRYILDEKGTILVARSFVYDQEGHLTKDTIYGNLTGLCKAPIEVDQEGTPLKNGIETYNISYEYINHLLTCTTEDNGKKTLYHYLPHSSLIASKIILDHEKVLSREFYFYNTNGQLIKICNDDGSSLKEDDLHNVTERHIKKISYRTQQPALGLTETIEDCFIDLSTGQEVLLKKIVYTYNSQAKIVRQDTYDANNQYHHSLHYSFDSRKRLTTSIDETGHIVEKCYDLNNNLTKNTSIDSKGLFQEITNHYDFANRLICTETFDNDNQPKKAYYHYDLKGNKIAFTDECGNQTNYVYDSMGREVEVILPAVLNAELNAVRPSKSRSYDALNRVISETDAKGLTTYTHYNARGKPTKIIYPDLRIESFIYNLDGTLQSACDSIGCRKVYQRDVQGRVNKLIVFEPNQKQREETIFIHNAFHLLEAIESSGQKIRYQYDEAGRLVTLEQYLNNTLSKRLTYSYNSLGQQVLSKEWWGPELEKYIATLKTFGAGNTLLSTSIETSEGQLQKYIPCEENSPQVMEHEEYVINNLGQWVIQKTVVSSLGLQTITTYDALKRPIHVIHKNSLGTMVGMQEMAWDLNNHKIRETNYIDQAHSLSTCWEYDSNDHLVKLIEGFGSERPQQTQYVYNEYSQLIQITKPDGVQINYQYTPSGQVFKLSSSDQSVDYTFTYNQKNHITGVYDKVQQTNTRRTYTEDGCLLHEQQGNLLETHRHYDQLNRCIKLELPDTSLINYGYEGIFLKEIQRHALNDRTYSHIYSERDLQGKLTRTELAGNLGYELRHYNEKGHLSSIHSPYGSENITYSKENPHTIEHVSFQRDTQSSNHTYSYDDQSRLIHEQGPFTQTFTYDWMGNQSSKNGQESILNPLGHYIYYHGSQCTYDQNGNLKEKVNSKGKYVFEYDALNRMTCMKNENGEIYRYSYDAFHRRLSKTCLGVDGEVQWTQRYLYDGLNEIGAVDEQGKITELRLLGEGLGAEIGAAVALEIKDRIYIPFHDHRGSLYTVRELDRPEVQVAFTYSAFGEEDSNENDSFIPWRFSSKRHDPESGFIYFGKRYYDPSLNQWTTQDPLGSIEGPNHYAYASNNPLTRVDPYGLFSFSTFWQSLYSGMIAFGQKIANVYHTVNDFVNQHLSLEHNFKNKIEDTAIAIFGKTWLNTYGFYVEKQEVGIFGQGEINDHVRITLINGILNARHDVMDTIEMISKLHGDNNIHYIFRPTEGWTYDIIKSTLVKFGWVSPQAKQLAARWKELIAEMGGVHGGGKIIHYAHSIGAKDTLNAKGLLSPEELSMIQVYTFGSPTLLPTGGFQSVTNYISRRDGVSILDPINYIRALLDPIDHVTFLQSYFWFPMADHSLTSITYQIVLESLGKQFIEMYAKN